jgi:hypothetical protein
METPLYVILGRNGDILAATPIVQHEIASGRKACMMVSREYADVLDGTSVPRIIWEQDWRLVRAAYESVKKDWPRIVVLQRYATDGFPVFPLTHSFVHDMYRIGGKLPLFGRLPLTFDRRSPEREAKLVASLPTDKPVVLVATRGISSPFAHGDELLALLEANFPQAVMLDMNTVRGERLYDLLALFERAACLVTVDSALLHLAQATPALPVVALIADHPSAWHGSPAYAGQRIRIRYGEFRDRCTEILDEVAACLVATPTVGSGPTPTSCGTGKLGR